MAEQTSLYDRYKHLLGRPYVDGTQDCYGLARDYYRDVYELELSNYARSSDFFFEGINLLKKFLATEGFKVVDVSLTKLELGDGLLMAVNSDDINHCAVYVGNNTLIHHQYEQASREDSLTTRRKHQIMAVCRHPDVTDANSRANTQVELMDLLPAHVKAQYLTPTE